MEDKEGGAMEGLAWGRKKAVVLKTYSTTSASISSRTPKSGENTFKF